MFAQDEKHGDYASEKPAAVPPKAGLEEEEEEEEEDMDALIEELESEDAAIDYEEDEVAQPGSARVVPEDLLQTDTRTGLTDAEVTSRRKKFGLNQMKGESSWRPPAQMPWNDTNIRNRGEGKLDSQVPHVLRRPYPVRHGGCCCSRRRSRGLG